MALEEVFWVEGTDGKWKPRSAPTRPVEELVLERSLVSRQGRTEEPLSKHPRPAGGTKRGRRGKIHA